ncbi:MAG: xylulokinase [Anaerolineaceae bacterium]|nr:xylulokinase [Anaerolineaceae bacterium]
MQYLLGLDISTTGAKALLCDTSGIVIDTASTELALSTPNPLWSEQNPEDWWNGIVNSIRTLLQKTNISGEEIIAIGLTGQMHGLTMLDADGQVIRPAILWNDQRTGPQCDEIRDIVGREKFIDITGNDALTGFTAPKILWVRENDPEAYNRTSHILLPKDYVRFNLTNVYASDRAGGSGTVLFNIKDRDWSSDIIKSLDIPESWLPKTYEGTEITGFISDEAAEITGLKAGIPVVGGGGDQAAGAVGAGAVESGIVSLTLGTSGVVFATTNSPFVESEGRLHAFCHAVPDRWHLMGVMLSAAGSLRWFRDTFAPQFEYDDLIASTAKIPVGSEGLYFLPYLTGERNPHPDPLARGGFIGLTVRHSFAHLTRSVLEGVGFGLKDSFELMKQAGLTDIQQIRISGGGSRNPIWRQILADILDTELVTINTSEGGAFGAALLAGVGVNVWKSIDQACKNTIQLTGSTPPMKDSVEAYQHHYDIYHSLYPTLKDTFQRI